MLIVMNDTDQKQKIKVTVDPVKLLNKKALSYVEDENGKQLKPAHSWQDTVDRQVFKIYYIK